MENNTFKTIETESVKMQSFIEKTRSLLDKLVNTDQDLHEHIRDLKNLGELLLASLVGNQVKEYQLSHSEFAKAKLYELMVLNPVEDFFSLESSNLSSQVKIQENIQQEPALIGSIQFM